MVGTAHDRNLVVEKTVDLLDIPRSYYERAVRRYGSIGAWLHRPESKVAVFNPAVYSQGSFRLGTVIRPLLPRDEYDLDIICEVQARSKADISQKDLKDLVGEELRLYALAHRIETPVKECPRCWRFNYADEVNFHIDTVPGLPEDDAFILDLIRVGVGTDLAQRAIATTCQSHENYAVICSDWPSGNPSGYAQWFERRFAERALRKRKFLLREGVYDSVEAVPLYALKTPLQRAVQFLKRHRDVMFRDALDLKPVSIIITTLAALSYAGEGELYETLRGVLQRVPEHVQRSFPRIANPVNPAEDFADRWKAKPELEQHFWLWYEAAVRDFDAIVSETSAAQLQKLSESRLAARMPDETANVLLGTPLAKRAAVVTPSIVIASPPKPWSNA
jgi:hypothetical protein